MAEAKLTPPAIREGAAAKADVLHRLRPTPRPTVALIVAPGGYGKTTVLVDLVRRPGGRPFAWIEIDEGDNDPTGFARCVGAALERSGAIDGDVLRRGARQGDSHAVLTARLVRALKTADPVVLVLDNLHLITGTRSLKVVEAVANNLPPQSQLLLSSRIRPRLGLTKLRAEGRLIELGTEDLRLTDDEALQLLETAGAETTREEAAALNARSEGWPAGLYLAARAHAGAGLTLASFGGSDRFVGDWFDAEYLSKLDDGDRLLLARASVLEELSGPFCDAVLGAFDSTARLERAARSNLFVIRLGAGRPHVYRFHTMLREALAAELRSREPGRAEAIAARAADFAERHGDLELAGEYAWAAGDHDRFAAIFERAALPLFHGGRLAILDRWVTLLGDELLERHPAAAVTGAYLHNLFGRPVDADSWAAVAERAPVETAMPDGTPSIEPWTATLRAARCRDGKDAMRHDAARALAGLADGSPWRPSALMLLGVGQLLEGEIAAADEILAEAHLAAMSAESANTAAIALAERSLLAVSEERWDDAETLAASAREVLREAHLDGSPTSSISFVASARSAVHRSDWVRAGNDLEQTFACLPESAPGWLAAQVHLEAARAHLGLSEREPAKAALARAESVLADSPDLGVLADQADDLRLEVERPARTNGARRPLTRAELRLLPLLTTHLTFREIAELLDISRNTVKTQTICTYRKLGVTSRSQAIDRAIELGLVERHDALQTAANRR